jgi:hypothetical protein
MGFDVIRYMVVILMATLLLANRAVAGLTEDELNLLSHLAGKGQKNAIKSLSDAANDGNLRAKAP